MSDNILYGSTATKHWFPDFREPFDTDYIARPNTVVKSSDKNKEVHYLPCFEWLLESKEHNIDGIASPEALYTIKLSHSFWDIHWSKTMRDILFFQEKGVQYIPEFFDVLYQGWYEFRKRDKDRMNFNVKNEDFFTKSVRRDVPHDLLHQIVKHNDEPLYRKIKNDQTMAAVSDDLFSRLSFGDKFDLCLEEIVVIAAERFLIPENKFGDEKSEKIAYSRSFKKNVVDLNKGEIPKFMVLNFNKFVNPCEYVFESFAKINSTINKNEINKKEGE